MMNTETSGIKIYDGGNEIIKHFIDIYKKKTNSIQKIWNQHSAWFFQALFINIVISSLFVSNKTLVITKITKHN